MRRTAIGIDTARLRLRPYRESDLDALHALWTDPDVRRYLWDDKLIERDVSERTMRGSMASTAEHGFGHWAVCPAGRDELIGFCGLMYIGDTRDVELLYGLLPAHWKQGLATEAAAAMLRFGFEDHGLERIYAITDAPNLASAAVMQRLGMQFEKRFLHHGLDSVRHVLERTAFRPGGGRYDVRYAAVAAPDSVPGGSAQQAPRIRVGILIFPEVEVLDFCGPFEVFSVTRRNEARRREEPSPFDVVLVAEEDGPVTATGGLRVLPDYTLASCPPLDLLVVPGGWGTRAGLGNRSLIDWIAARGRQAATLTSVCTGAMLLGQAGLLDGRHATTHWRSLDWMQQSFPHVVVERAQHVVEDGNLLTSAGISAGIDMALRVVARYCGEEIGRATARHMEYPYPDDNRRRV
jgi:RimJ/RimL family protein N-acetyltransferase/putative intracellular protease/amidase